MPSGDSEFSGSSFPLPRPYVLTISLFRLMPLQFYCFWGSGDFLGLAEGSQLASGVGMRFCSEEIAFQFPPGWVCPACLRASWNFPETLTTIPRRVCVLENLCLGLCLKMVTKICLTCGISVITRKNGVQVWALSRGGDEERAKGRSHRDAQAGQGKQQTPIKALTQACQLLPWRGPARKVFWIKGSANLDIMFRILES